MNTNRIRVIAFTVALLVGAYCAWPAMAADDAASLAKAAQNPVASMISLPMQLNMNFGTGPEDDLQTVLNIQPVVPFSASENWNLKIRGIEPLIGSKQLLERLAGWCRRRENPRDRRSSYVALTPAGRRLLAAAGRTFAEEVEGRLRSPLSSRQFQEFAATIRQLRDALRSPATSFTSATDDGRGDRT